MTVLETSRHVRSDTELHCTALHCTALCCTALCCTALHCTAPYGTVRNCTALHRISLHCIILSSTALHCTARHLTALYSTLLSKSPGASVSNDSTVSVMTVQYSTVSVMTEHAPRSPGPTHQVVAVCCILYIAYVLKHAVAAKAFGHISFTNLDNLCTELEQKEKISLDFCITLNI